jgi:peroxiredoxin (alkyl hydroperoxide reductase subunit C)
MFHKKNWRPLLGIVAVMAMTAQVSDAYCPKIGDKAPAFVADSTKGKIRFPHDYKGKWVIFFSHPADFTPVCTTEFKEFSRRTAGLKELNTEFLGISTDPKYMHDAWIRSLEKQGASKITFPVIADLTRKISYAYNMIHPKESKLHTVRAIYFIDPRSTIRAIMYYPKRNGRGTREILRLLAAMQATDKTGGLTPADWRPGQKMIKKIE